MESSAKQQEPDPDELPAWSLERERIGAIDLASGWPEPPTREWAWGGSTGKGVRVCMLDSGVDGSHPLVGGLSGAFAVEQAGDDVAVLEDEAIDKSGHGTACAGIVRSLAPDCDIYSVRVLGSETKGRGSALLAGLHFALEQGFEVINLSLSTTKRDLAAALHDLADTAYFRRSVLVCSAHNLAVNSYPWRFAAVISVGSHEEPEPATYFYNPDPPVEFYARGLDVEVAWTEGQRMRVTGNSFATPHISGICALILGKHPELTPFQLKSLLHLTADNVDPEAR